MEREGDKVCVCVCGGGVVVVEMGINEWPCW